MLIFYIKKSLYRTLETPCRDEKNWYFSKHTLHNIFTTLFGKKKLIVFFYGKSFCSFVRNFSTFYTISFYVIFFIFLYFSYLISTLVLYVLLVMLKKNNTKMEITAEIQLQEIPDRLLIVCVHIQSTFPDWNSFPIIYKFL